MEKPFQLLVMSRRNIKMKVPKAKIVKMIQEMLDTPGHVQVQKTEDGLLVVDVPGSDAKAVFSEEEARELVKKLIAALN